MGNGTKTRLTAKRLAAGIVCLAWLVSVLSCNLSALNAGDPNNSLPTLEPTATAFQPEVGSTAFFASPQPTLSPIPVTETPAATRTKAPPEMYTVQPGDSLAAVAARFGVAPGDIQSPDPIERVRMLNAGQLLIIPRVIGETSPTTMVMPDSEVVYSPSTLDFDINAFVKSAGGYLSTYTEYTGYGSLSGAEVVNQVALDNSVNPRLLLALLEYQAHWVFGAPTNLADSLFPIEKNMYQSSQGLFNELTWAAHTLQTGYYGWRAGTLIQVTFPDGTNLRLAPETNAGTVSLAYLFSKLINQRQWSDTIYGSNGFMALYDRMYGSAWERAQTVEPLFPPELVQPALDLPFYPGIVWSFSGGPHEAWADGSPLAAVDFAPGSTASGCVPSEAWVLAPAAGIVVRSSTGVVVLDLDGDGHEQTGWDLLFLHIRTDGRVAAGTRLNKDDPIGHPSCEGGIATGTHVHIARKYNGEWIPADGPLPMVLGGWQVHAGAAPYKGTLTNNGKTVTADTNGSGATQIKRPGH